MISISLLPYVFEDKTDLFYQHKESLNYSLINDYYASGKEFVINAAPAEDPFDSAD